jgi:hypothetical protein
MGNFDKNPQGYPLAGYKRDFNLYIGGGSGGGGIATVTGTTRYTFWVDFSKFDVAIRRLITQNVSFEIWKDSGLMLPAPFYIDVGMSNDRPDDAIRAAISGGANNAVLIDSATTPPPYFLNINFLTQPTDSNYQTDQGRWNYPQYNGNGLGTGNSTSWCRASFPARHF